jgi:hypothetical protein
MEVFNHFMIGKAEIDDSMKADIQRQQNDAQLMQMLRQKEISNKLGVTLDNVFTGRTDHSE